LKLSDKKAKSAITIHERSRSPYLIEAGGVCIIKNCNRPSAVKLAVLGPEGSSAKYASWKRCPVPQRAKPPSRRQQCDVPVIPGAAGPQAACGNGA